LHWWLSWRYSPPLITLFLVLLDHAHSGEAAEAAAKHAAELLAQGRTLEEEETERAEDAEFEGLPFACFICRKPFVDPVVTRSIILPPFSFLPLSHSTLHHPLSHDATLPIRLFPRCQHYFCEACAIKHYGKDPKCAICSEDTLGIFNTAAELRTEKARRYIARMAARTPLEAAASPEQGKDVQHAKEEVA